MWQMSTLDKVHLFIQLTVMEQQVYMCVTCSQAYLRGKKGKKEIFILENSTVCFQNGGEKSKKWKEAMLLSSNPPL